MLHTLPTFPQRDCFYQNIQSVVCGLMQMMKPSSNPPPIVAVDAPSGWHVENGDESGLILVTETCLCHTDTACLTQKVALQQHASGC